MKIQNELKVMLKYWTIFPLFQENVDENFYKIEIKEKTLMASFSPLASW
jgi:hypothetical protein